jgi:phosphoribosylformimino-5-aminoimidazole carboxamide ribotide isomerase
VRAPRARRHGARDRVQPQSAAQAQSFVEQGFEYLHVVDLDGAFAGKPVNAQAVEAMLKTIKIPVQLGGGIRDLATVEAWLDKGITRVIIGTAAVRDPELVKAAARKFPGRVAVGLDARDGKVAVEGWAETSQVTVLEIAKRFRGCRRRRHHLHRHRARRLASRLESRGDHRAGGCDLDSRDRLRRPRLDRGRQGDADAARRKLAGAIAGRALYDGRLDPAAALTLIRNARA